MEPHIYGVTEVNQLVKGLLDSAPALQGVAVRGELSNYKIYPSGHHYFTLKDQEGALRCVMFRGQASRLRFRPENGMKAVASGRITVFPRDGAYQLYCDSLIPEGVGDLAVAFQQLKEKLWKEGLFDPAHKKPLPPYPEKIAIVTSGAGAAVHDMIRILRRLWAFNDERVARAIYDCETPIISAVGHEPDVTIADFVADARASTPSNAAEIAVPDQVELLRWLRGAGERMARSETARLETARQRLTALAAKRVMTDGMAYVQDKRLDLDHLQQRLGDVTGAVLGRHRQKFAALAASLDAMSPLAVLGRGYAVARDEQGKILKSWRETAPGSRVSVTLGEGGFTAVVDKPYTKEEQP